MPEKKRGPSGNTIAGVGGATAGLGLVAGGVPGVKSNINPLLNPPKHRKAPEGKFKNVKGIERTARAWGHATRGGILGLRTHAHQGGLYQFDADAKAHAAQGAKTPAESFLHGYNAGKVAPEAKIIRHMQGGKKVAAGALAAGAATTAFGAHRSRVKKSKTRRTDAETVGSAAVGVGGTAAVAGHGTKKLFSGQQKKWRKITDTSNRQSKELVGHMTPKLAASKPELLSGVDPKVARTAGELRGTAAQANHFAHVFGNTARVMGHVRSGGLALGAAGAGGVAATRYGNKRNKVVKSAGATSDRMSAFGVEH